MKKGVYQKIFKDKKITVMGLGLLGRGLQVSAFLAQAGAKLTITDLKTAEELKASIKKLQKYRVRYVLGKHDLKDFENVDIIIKSAGVPLDSVYIQHAKEKSVPIEMDASLFVKIVKKIYPKVKIVGITGTRGKSMTTALIHHILNENSKILNAKIFLGGNMRNTATLPILNKIKPNDIVVLELDSWQCQGFGDCKISPDISVFTNIMKDHMNYYRGNIDTYLRDKSNIYKFQKKSDILITNTEMLKKFKLKPKSKIIIPTNKTIKSLKNINLNIFGKHNIQNTSLAVEVVSKFGLKQKEIIKSLKTFKGLEGRLEIIINNKATFINDNNATTPEATGVGIKAVKEKYKKGKIILIVGGSDKTLDLSPLLKEIKKVHKTILLPGTGTNKLLEKIKTKYILSKNLKEAVGEAVKNINSNDVILFSPGFASFGLFKNEYDRNDQFLNIIKKWK